MWIDKVVYQNCGVQLADWQTDRQTHTGTDKSLKTEGPKILSNGIFYFRTVIIGGPIWPVILCLRKETWLYFNDLRIICKLPFAYHPNTTLFILYLELAYFSALSNSMQDCIYWVVLLFQSIWNLVRIKILICILNCHLSS